VTCSFQVIIEDQQAMFTGQRQDSDRPKLGVKLETQKLSYVVAGNMLVDDVNVQVYPGEVLAVIGPSGAGKSSFLRLLNRLDEPTAGTVLLNGRDYRALTPQELRRRVGMVMQTPFLFPGTVAANVAFGPKQTAEPLDADQIATLLERVGLPGCENRDVTNLSGGEAQRVSIARALANRPEVLLLDEPTSALDELSAKGIEHLLVSLNRERGMTSVIVTHNKPQAMRTATRTMVMETGKLIVIGPTKEVLDAHQSVE
jgi:putative ABC transport system ATP-binding protein